MGDLNVFKIIKQNITIEDFKDNLNKQIATKLYEELEKEIVILIVYWII